MCATCGCLTTSAPAAEEGIYKCVECEKGGEDREGDGQEGREHARVHCLRRNQGSLGQCLIAASLPCERLRVPARERSYRMKTRERARWNNPPSGRAKSKASAAWASLHYSAGSMAETLVQQRRGIVLLFVRRVDLGARGRPG